MLSADEIVDAIEHGAQRKATGISIVPKPDLVALKDRGASSVDLRLGRWFVTVRQTRTTSMCTWNDGTKDDGNQSKRHFVPFTKPFVLHPSRFVLAATLEWLSLPPDISGFVTGKSALGRRGLIIETAAGIHPGFSGCLTLELANVGEVPLEIAPGMQICQVMFHRTRCVENPSPGSFAGRRRPTIGKIKMDAAWEKLKPR